MQCCLCRNGELYSRNDLKAHLAIVHIEWIPYECALCLMVFLPTKPLLKRHFDATHPTQPVKTKYIYNEEKSAALKELLRQCIERQEKITHDKESNLMESNNDGLSAEIPKVEIHNHNDLKSEINGRWPHSGESLSQLPRDEATEISESPSTKQEGKKSMQMSHQRPNDSSATTPLTVSFCRLCNSDVKQQQCGIHLWTKHMSQNRFLCRQCPQQTATRTAMHTHLRHQHAQRRPKKEHWVDRANNKVHRQEYGKIFRQAYGRRIGEHQRQNKTVPPDDHRACTPNTTSEGSSSGGGYFCLLCQQYVPKGGHAHVDHIWRYHTDVPRFVCRHCDKHTVRRDQMRRHQQKVHGKDGDEHFIDHIDDDTHRQHFIQLRRSAYDEPCAPNELTEKQTDITLA